MKPHSWITFVLGIVLSILGIAGLIMAHGVVGLIPLIFGLSLVYLGWRGDRTSLLVFGHTSVVIGAAMIAWGIYLLPYSKPTFFHIIGRPLFWGFIALFGGICSIYHGFCRCIRVPKKDN
jgi:hypothetical protein